MPKGNPSYFGIKLGEALSTGAGHIANAIQRQYEIQRQAELDRQRQDLLRQQTYQQELGNRISLAKAGVQVPNVPASPNFGPLGPDQPMRFPDLSQIHQDYLANRNLERRGQEAEIGYKESQSKALSEKPKALTKAQSAVDTTFGKDYAEYISGGGFADTKSQIDALEGVLQQLKSGKENLTGIRVGLTPSAIRPYVNPESLAAQQAVEQSVQRTLKKTLGGQFTEREGVLFMQRGYDPRLSMKENAKKLERMIGQLKAMAEAKQSAAEYFEANDTLAGYKGSIYTLSNGVPMKIKATEENISSAPESSDIALSPEKAKRLMELRAKKAGK